MPGDADRRVGRPKARRGKCPRCGRIVSTTGSGRTRGHEPPRKLCPGPGRWECIGGFPLEWVSDAPR